MPITPATRELQEQIDAVNAARKKLTTKSPEVKAILAAIFDFAESLENANVTGEAVKRIQSAAIRAAKAELIYIQLERKPFFNPPANDELIR